MSLRIFLLLLPIFFNLSLFAQPFQIGNRTQTFVDPSRSNRQIPCEIYYPASIAGTNTPLAAGSFPVISFGHGFVMPPSAYSPFWNNLVPQGYILILPSTESSFSPSHENFGRDLAFIITAMKNEGNNASSPFFNSIANTSAVMGHSMGGGCSFLAMQFDTSITAMASFAAAVTNPSSVSAASNITKPSIVFSGANDCVAPPPAHQIPMYDSLNSDCKTFVSITGGNHCQFAGFNFNCTLGQSTCSPQATISEADQQNLVFTSLGPWLDFYLKNNCNAGTDFQNTISTGTGISSQQNCSLACAPTAERETLNETPHPAFCPNPADQNIQFLLTNNSSFEIHLIDLNGKLILSKSINNSNNSLSTSDLNNGVYILKIKGQNPKKLIVAHQN